MLIAFRELCYLKTHQNVSVKRNSVNRSKSYFNFTFNDAVGYSVALFTTDVFTVTLCPVFIGDKM